MEHLNILKYKYNSVILSKEKNIIFVILIKNIGVD